AILLLVHNVSAGLVVRPAVIRKHLMDELPFMATEPILMRAVKAGGDRQELHERIRQHSVAAANRVKDEGAPNDLIERIASDPAFGLSRAAIEETLDPARHTGRAAEQVDQFLETHVAPVPARHPADASVPALRAWVTDSRWTEPSFPSLSSRAARSATSMTSATTGSCWSRPIASARSTWRWRSRSRTRVRCSRRSPRGGSHDWAIARRTTSSPPTRMRSSTRCPRRTRRDRSHQRVRRGAGGADPAQACGAHADHRVVARTTGRSHAEPPHPRRPGCDPEGAAHAQVDAPDLGASQHARPHGERGADRMRR